MSLAWFLDFLTSAPALIPPLAGLPLVSRRGPPPAAAGAPLSVTWTLNPSTSVRRFRLLLSPDNIRHRSPLHPVAWLRPYLLRLVFLTLSLLVQSREIPSTPSDTTEGVLIEIVSFLPQLRSESFVPFECAGRDDAGRCFSRLRERLFFLCVHVQTKQQGTNFNRLIKSFSLTHHVCFGESRYFEEILCFLCHIYL